MLTFPRAPKGSGDLLDDLKVGLGVWSKLSQKLVLHIFACSLADKVVFSCT